MPFYRPEDLPPDFVPSGQLDLEEVPRAVVAIGGSMDTKGIEVPVHEHRKAQLQTIAFPEQRDAHAATCAFDQLRGGDAALLAQS